MQLLIFFFMLQFQVSVESLFVYLLLSVLPVFGTTLVKSLAQIFPEVYRHAKYRILSVVCEIFKPLQTSCSFYVYV